MAQQEIQKGIFFKLDRNIYFLFPPFLYQLKVNLQLLRLILFTYPFLQFLKNHLDCKILFFLFFSVVLLSIFTLSKF